MRTRLAAIILFLLLSPLARAQKDHYADALATGTADGSSWVNAFTSLQQAADALAPRDTLHTRGTFFETVTISTESVTILGDSDPTKPTWIRGDRYGSPEKWTPAGPEGVYVYQDVSQLIGSTLKPGSVVYDYKRDTLTGSVTGIDLRRFYSELHANGAGVYFGHLIKCNGISDVSGTPSSWWWDFANDRVYVHIPAGAAFRPRQTQCLHQRQERHLSHRRQRPRLGCQHTLHPGHRIEQRLRPQGHRHNLRHL